jgi:two-component system, NarL family, response regulator NreC
MNPIRVLIVDDHTILRQGLRRLLESEGMTVVGEANNGREAVDRIKDTETDVVLMDLNMPSLNGVEATRKIKSLKPGVKVVVLSMYVDDEYVAQSLEAGVSGYVMKDAPADELLEAVNTVAAGGEHFTSRIPKPAAGDRTKRVALTPRENEVLKLLAEGHSVKKIAGILNVSPKTVDVHKTRLMKKLDIHNRANLVKYAVAKKVIHI